ncbi:MAG: hypothetical protein HQ498_12710 [Pseudohongiella sp.]|nr:hypothetical protein [Pseudohongiella sp.]
MKLTIKESIETIGIVSIVASLIFVGMQLRLDRDVAVAEVYIARTESRRADLRAFLESEASLQELANYRSESSIGSSFPIPEAWINEENPILTEARKIRMELNVLAMDLSVFQTSLGLYDSEQIRELVERQFRADPESIQFALSSVSIHDSTRSLLESISKELDHRN